MAIHQRIRRDVRSRLRSRLRADLDRRRINVKTLSSFKKYGRKLIQRHKDESNPNLGRKDYLRSLCCHLKLARFAQKRQDGGWNNGALCGAVKRLVQIIEEMEMEMEIV